MNIYGYSCLKLLSNRPEAALKQKNPSHTCDKFKKGIREVFLSFQGGFSKCKEYIGKLLIHIREIFQFCKKLYVLEEILRLISGSLPDDQGGITCMPCSN